MEHKQTDPILLFRKHFCCLKIVSGCRHISDIVYIRLTIQPRLSSRQKHGKFKSFHYILKIKFTEGRWPPKKLKVWVHECKRPRKNVNFCKNGGYQKVVRIRKNIVEAGKYLTLLWVVEHRSLTQLNLSFETREATLPWAQQREVKCYISDILLGKFSLIDLHFASLVHTDDLFHCSLALCNEIILANFSFCSLWIYFWGDPAWAQAVKIFVCPNVNVVFLYLPGLFVQAFLRWLSSQKGKTKMYNLRAC